MSMIILFSCYVNAKKKKIKIKQIFYFNFSCFSVIHCYQ